MERPPQSRAQKATARNCTEAGAGSPCGRTLNPSTTSGKRGKAANPDPAPLNYFSVSREKMFLDHLPDTLTLAKMFKLSKIGVNQDKIDSVKANKVCLHNLTLP